MTRTRGRVRLTAEQRRDTIMAAATAVFAEYGYQRAKMSEVAARVGVSEPVVFQNFGSKAELFAAVLDRAAGTAAEVLAVLDAGELPLVDVLRGLLAAEHVDAMHAPGAMGVLFADGVAAGTDPGVAQATQRAIGRVAHEFASLLERGRDSGQLRADLDPEAAAWSLISLVAARSLRRAVVGESDVERRLVDMTLDALTP